MIKRVLKRSLLASVLAMMPSFVEASISTIPELIHWVDHYPSKRMGGVDALSVKEFRKRLAAVLGERRYNEFLKIDKRGVETPMSRHGDFLYFTICEMHYCVHQYHFLVEMRRSAVFVCERNMRIPSAKSKSPIMIFATWYSDKGSAKINDQRCEVISEETGKVDLEKTLALIPPDLR